MKFYPNPIILANQINFCKSLKNSTKLNTFL